MIKHSSLGLSVLVCISMLLGSAARAGFKTDVDGVTVSYSIDGGADVGFDPTDNTLTVIITVGGGSLKIGAKECSNWGGFVDVYLLAPDANLTSISIKGSSSCFFSVAGYVDYAAKLSMSYGSVGFLACYPSDFGLYEFSDAIPASISIKNGWAEGAVFGAPVGLPPNLCAASSTSAASPPPNPRKQRMERLE